MRLSSYMLCGYDRGLIYQVHQETQESNRENKMKCGIPLSCLCMILISQGLCLGGIWNAVCAQSKRSTDAWIAVC